MLQFLFFLPIISAENLYGVKTSPECYRPAGYQGMEWCDESCANFDTVVEFCPCLEASIPIFSTTAATPRAKVAKLIHFDSSSEEDGVGAENNEKIEPIHYGNKEDQIIYEKIHSTTATTTIAENGKMRKAFYGGRTGPLRLLQKADKNNKISVFDIISLYSSINYATEYPVGIPNIIRPHASETKVDWKSPAEIIYKGLLKVRIIPPKGLHIPVIPLRMDERLLFPCCGKCAKNFRTCNTRQHNYKCNHTDFDRSFVTTVTHIELKHSLERGYICDRFYRAWHYEKWTNNLFSDYVRHFMRLKVEASGFPPGIISDEEKAEFVKRYKDEMNIIIRLDHVKKNPGLRYIAKICLNSLWGKFSQRNNLGKNIALREPSKFYELVYDHRIEIDNITKISEPAIRVHFKRKNDFIEEGSCSSIVISLWTTSAARLALLRFMEQVQSRRGCKILYTDTDSIIVYHPRNVEPLDTGDMLGCMQEEYNSYDIVEFCSGDAKQYGLHLSNKENGEETFLLKIRGITLDQKNCKKFHYNDFRNMVKQFGRNQLFCFKYRKIGPRRDSKIIVRDMEKKYLPVMQKGIVTENLDVLPFGFE